MARKVENQLKARNISFEAFRRDREPEGGNFSVTFEGLFQFACADSGARNRICLLTGGLGGVLGFMILNFDTSFGGLPALFGIGGLVAAFIWYGLLASLAVFLLVRLTRTVRTAGWSNLIGTGTGTGIGTCTAPLDRLEQAYDRSVKRGDLTSTDWPGASSGAAPEAEA